MHVHAFSSHVYFIAGRHFGDQGVLGSKIEIRADIRRHHIYSLELNSPGFLLFHKFHEHLVPPSISFMLEVIPVHRFSLYQDKDQFVHLVTNCGWKGKISRSEVNVISSTLLFLSR